jgi:hypothetical protein
MRSIHSITATGLRLILGLIAANAVAPLASGAAASSRAPDAMRQMVHDTRSGLAMFGYDAVAFHSDGKAVLGRPEFSAYIGGYLWHFASASNRAAFVADPDPYLPLFGGHDARGIGENRMVKGDPAHFVFVGGRTAFFRTLEDRDAFAADEALRRRALQQWPDVARQFAGH